MAPVHRVLSYGDRALLVEWAEVEVLPAHVAEAVLAGCGDRCAVAVPGARTVLVVASPGTTPADLVPLLDRAWSEVVEGAGASAAVTDDLPVEVRVVYDGEDLAAVAEHCGLTPDEVVAAHTGTSWTVGFAGFAPGFPYLVGGDPRLRVPRRSDPRPRVPAGSVALADDLSGIYPSATPGGWQLIGRTEAVLWDVDRDPPALLPPGTVVRFVAEGPA
ncbi:MAG: allophanate hydrolase subunit 1 [Nocardioides sp.]|nr:allophanate hydrolase subunit 1 [Nocardioides sp.]